MTDYFAETLRNHAIRNGRGWAIGRAMSTWRLVSATWPNFLRA